MPEPEKCDQCGERPATLRLTVGTRDGELLDYCDLCVACYLSGVRACSVLEIGKAAEEQGGRP